MEQGAFDYFRRIDELGGMVEAIEAGFPQREIADAAYRFQRALDAGEKIDGRRQRVHRDPSSTPLPDPLHRRARPRASRRKLLARGPADARREGRRVEARPTCGRPARTATNVMPPLVEAVKTYATVGEISDVMREVFATYEEPAVF